MPGTPAFDPEQFTKDSRQVWSQAAPHYCEMSARLFEPGSATFVEFAGLKSGERVLDVACGTGMATIAAARRVTPGGSVLGVDFSGDMLAFAEKNAEAAGVKVEFREMDAEALHLPDAGFDAVICQLGLMLFAKPAKALSEMARVAKSGGRVACCVQGVPEKMLFTSLLNKTMVRHAPQLKIPGAPTIYDFGPEGVLEKAFSAAGLARVQAKRLAGTFHFASAEEYWNLMAAGAGRTGVMLKSLSPELRVKVQSEVFDKLAAFRSSGGLDIPYEFVLALGTKN